MSDKRAGYLISKKHPIPRLHTHRSPWWFTHIRMIRNSRLQGHLQGGPIAGCQVISVIITSGESGSNLAGKDERYKPELAKLREAEQLAAIQYLGISETIFLHYPDGILQPSLDLRRDLTRLIRKYKPAVVITGDPTVRFYGNEYMNHPDHRVAADVML